MMCTPLLTLIVIAGLGSYWDFPSMMGAAAAWFVWQNFLVSNILSSVGELEPKWNNTKNAL